MGEREETTGQDKYMKRHPKNIHVLESAAE